MAFDDENINDEPVEAKPIKKKAKKIVFNRSSVNSSVSSLQSQSARVEVDESNAPDDDQTGTNGHIESSVPNVPDIAPKVMLKPRGDKNFMRVMELEKEVLELYKMLDYWKSEAKTL